MTSLCFFFNSVSFHTHRGVFNFILLFLVNTMSFEVEEETVIEVRLVEKQQVEGDDSENKVSPITLNETVTGETSSSPNSVGSCLSITLIDPNSFDLKTDEDKVLKPALQTPSTVVEQITSNNTFYIRVLSHLDQ